MDHQPSFWATVTPSSSVDGETSSGGRQQEQQPTYTTAGTIYKPSSAQPIQPPTRRGRSVKWPATNTNSELTLLPRSFVHSLTNRPFMTGRSPPLPQYSPLQQNYDRAISPSCRLESVTDDMAQAQMSISTSNGLTTRASPGKNTQIDEISTDIVDDDENDGEDKENDERLQSLVSTLTIKSLHNLASYPNPNQRSAQMAIRQGARLRSNYAVTNSPTELMAYTRYSESPLHSNAGLGFLDVCQESPDFTAPNTVRNDGVVAVHSKSDPPYLTTDQTRASRQSGPLTYSEAASSARYGSAVLSEGPGAPRPLTAGPPGQRQYRPSTFESTLKALNVRGVGSRGERCDRYEDVAIDDKKTTGLEHGTTLKSHSALDYHACDKEVDYHYGNRLSNAPGSAPILGQATSVITNTGNIAMTCSRNYPGNAISTWSDDDDDDDDAIASYLRDWRLMTTTQENVEELDDTLACREDKINDFWYSGIRSLNQSATRINKEILVERATSGKNEGEGKGIASYESLLFLALASLTRTAESNHAGGALTSSSGTVSFGCQVGSSGNSRMGPISRTST